MRHADVVRLGKGIYQGEWRPYRAKARGHVAEFGLDTEYYRDQLGENVQLSWQLAYDTESGTHFDATPFGTDAWSVLNQHTIRMVKDAGEKIGGVTLVVLYCFFSTAEGQWLPLKHKRPNADAKFVPAKKKAGKKKTVVDDGLNKMEVFGSHQVNRRAKVTSRRVLYLFDLSVFFPGKSLKEAAASYGLTKLDYDVSELSEANLLDADFIRYARNDAWIVRELGRKVREQIQQDFAVDILLTRSPGSVTSAAFRARYVTEPVKQDWTLLRRTAAEAAIGARKEVFFRGWLPMVREYDAKSMYPNSVLALGVLPLPGDWKFTADIDRWLNAAGGIGDIQFCYPADCQREGFIPAIPVYSEDKLTFPLEGFSTCSSFEAKLAIEQGATVTLLRGFYYNTGVTWMADYQKELIELRNSVGGSAIGGLYKLLANSTIGKMAQRVEEYDLNEMLRYSEAQGAPASVFKDCVNLPIKKHLRTGTLFMPEWFSLVLGYARANVARAAILTDALQIATDCVITAKDMGEGFMVGNINYRLEKTEEYVSYRAGLYRVGGDMRYHGANKEVAHSILDSFREDASVSYAANRIITLKQSFWTGKKYGKMVKQQRNVSLKFDGKRIMMPDGMTVPFRRIEDMPTRKVKDYDWTEPVDEDSDKRAELIKERTPIRMGGLKFNEAN